MKNKTMFDCFVLMGTALSIRGGNYLPEMERPLNSRENNVYITRIYISLVIEEINVNQDNMVMEIDGILSQTWIDPNLGANEHTKKSAVSGKIWEPKIVNINGNNVMQKDEDTTFWRGYGDEGNILLSKKIKLTTRCSRLYQKFPFDTQHCNLKFVSYRFPDDEIILRWSETEIIILNEPKTTEFELLNIRKHTDTEIRSSGNFSVASVNFLLERKFVHYIICIGAPCTLMVFLNYIALWIKLDKRCNMNIFSFGINLYFYSTSLCSIYPVPYFKALDIFVGLCSCFSLISMLVTFAIDRLTNSDQKFLHRMTNSRETVSEIHVRRIIHWLELGMKIIFPFLYLSSVSFFVFAYVM